jgi:hypothetical protein
MGKRVLKLTERQIKNVLDTIINEQHGTGPFVREPGPGQLKTRTISRPVTIPGSLFPTGKSEVIQNSNEFTQAKNAINNALKKTKDLSVNVVGGASSAGASVQFNTRLAQKRSENFVKVLKQEFPNVKFTVGKPVVGDATVLNSKEALAQQNVTLFFTTTEEEKYVTQAVDNTAVAMKGNFYKKGDKIIPIKSSNPYVVCFEVDGSIVDSVIKTVSSINGVSNVTKKKKEKGFWDRWFS